MSSFWSLEALLLIVLPNTRLETEWSLLNNWKWIVFEVLGNIFEILDNRELLCTHCLETLSLFRLVEKKFVRSEPHVEQYLGESTSFGVNSITKWPSGTDVASWYNCFNWDPRPIKTSFGDSNMINSF